MALLGNPQDVLTTPYGYSGQMSPETAVQEQNLNRRRLIANMLVQQGLQPKQGRMAGRFYVAANPLEHVAGLAQTAAGMYGQHVIDSKQKDLMDADRQSVVDAIRAHQEKMKGLSAPPAPVQAPPEPPPAPAPPQQPYNGEVGAMAQPDMAPAPPSPEAFRGIAPGQPDKFTGVSNFQARPDTLGSGIQPGGLDPHNITPADMSQFAPHPEEANQPPAVPAPAPPPQPAPVQPAPRKQTMDDLVDLLTHQHPQVRAYGQLLAQQMMRDQEHQRDQSNKDREFGLSERGLDARMAETRALREGNELYRKASLDQQKELTQATQGIAQQNADRADARDKILAAQGNAKLGLDREELGLRRQQLEMGKTPPGYRKTSEGNLEAIPGGPADTKLQGVFNQDTAQLNSSTANLDRLSSTVNQLLNHPGIEGITGIRGKIPDIPGTDAANARALLNTLKSQIAFDVLQDMRNNSKTGGALGNVSDAEGKRLENNLAAIDTTQSTPALKKQLQDIIGFSEGAKGRLRDAFNMKHNKGAAQTTPAAPTERSVKRTGMHNGKKVIEYSDGSIEYAN